MKKRDVTPIPEAPVPIIPKCAICLYLLDHKCRRMPPTIHVTGDSIWPSVAPGEWCGEFRAK